MRYLALFFGTVDLGALDRDLVARHFDWLAQNEGVIQDAGGLRADMAEGFVGAAWIIRAESLPAARDIMAQDPFVAAGLYARTDCYIWGNAFPVAPELRSSS